MNNGNVVFIVTSYVGPPIARLNRTASGHAAAPPSTAMNVRRFIR
jgi:hypothetical protein